MRRTAMRWESWSPCEKFRRAMFMPAPAIRLSVCVESHAGPIVQMIFVCRNSRRSAMEFVAAECASDCSKPLLSGAFRQAEERRTVGVDGFRGSFEPERERIQIDHVVRRAEDLYRVLVLLGDTGLFLECVVRV